MSAQVFVYGTLLVPEMMRAVSGRDFKPVAATAEGYGRYYVKGRVYPGIIAEMGSTVEGLVYLDVDTESLARLDYFEGPEYVREQLCVSTGANKTLAAEAYVVPMARCDMLTRDTWTVEAFRREGMLAFVDDAKKIMTGFASERDPKR
jgi:gamma-glutamylcyclotransferase (GGCT)/AIG2-like uncharacterized protein YtfP